MLSVTNLSSAKLFSKLKLVTDNILFVYKCLGGVSGNTPPKHLKMLCFLTHFVCLAKMCYLTHILNQIAKTGVLFNTSFL